MNGGNNGPSEEEKRGSEDGDLPAGAEANLTQGRSVMKEKIARAKRTAELFKQTRVKRVHDN
ncbi:hypothetical protein [Sphingomonas sp. KC8]|uniref:hypothetical protein n=1 Tax=Sphingomonas sp. KC8 TaxID=1030157 RepID=UPI0002EE864D|nr:hypothetical protein [Sphingomonas sp. KC8]